MPPNTHDMVAPKQDGTAESENLAKLAHLREHLATLAIDQQAFYDRDGNMDNWATKMKLLQYNIGVAIVQLEQATGRVIANTPDELAWSNSVRANNKKV